MFSKIDRALCNTLWEDAYPHVEVSFLSKGDFDHSPVLLQFFAPSKWKPPFWFCNFWVDKPTFSDVVQDVWRTHVPGHLSYQIQQKLNVLKHSLRKHFHHTPLQKTLHQVEAEFVDIQEKIHGDPGNTALVNREIDCAHRLKVIKSELTSLLQQRAKVNWLKYRDDNTAFFHNSIKHRSSHNKINTLVIDGITVSNPISIKQAFLSFYSDTGPILSISMHSCLNLSFSAEEIKDAMWSIDDNKAPGIDGYNSKFYKAAWHIIGKDIVEAIQLFFSNGQLLKNCSVTAITLIPQVPCPSSPGDYRPISCCYVIYKCISKLVCMQPKKVLGGIISQSQRLL